jgi:hypothetical protein
MYMEVVSEFFRVVEAYLGVVFWCIRVSSVCLWMFKSNKELLQRVIELFNNVLESSKSAE